MLSHPASNMYTMLVTIVTEIMACINVEKGHHCICSGNYGNKGKYLLVFMITGDVISIKHVNTKTGKREGGREEKGMKES